MRSERAAGLAWLAVIWVLGCSDDASPSPECPTALEGEAPFGAVLAGTSQLTVTSDTGGRLGETVETNVSFEVYFPEGRHAGAPVVFGTQEQYPERALRFSQSRLDDSGAATIEWSGKHGMEDLDLHGTLVGPTGGLTAQLSVNVAEPGSDVIVNAIGDVLLCPAGSAPPPTLETQGVFGPITPLTLLPSAPMDEESATATASVLDGAVAVTTSTDGGRLTVEAVTAFPPGREVSLDTSGAVDVIGRPFVLAAGLTPLVTTAVLSDLTFGSAPPAGSIVWAPQQTTYGESGCRDGVCVLGVDDGDLSALAALPDLGEATHVHVRLSWDAASANACQSIAAAMVDAQGTAGAKSVVKPVGTAQSPLELELPVPGPGPLWLAMFIEGPDQSPQTTWTQPCLVSLDEIQF